MFFALICVVFVVIFALQRLRLGFRRNPLSLPPGPKPNFLLDNVLDVPKTLQWKVFADWRKDFGNILHLGLFGRHIIVLNSYKLAHEMLGKRASLYAHRPSHPMAELCGFNKAIIFAPYGSTWRGRRRLVQRVTSRANIPAFHPGLESGIRRFLQELGSRPEGWSQNLRLTVGGMVIKSTYGLEIQSPSDPILVSADEAVRATTKIMFGTHIVDFLPFLRRLPTPILALFPFHRKSTKWRAALDRCMEIPFTQVKERLSSPSSKSLPASIVSSASNKYSDQDVMWACGTLYGAATDTSCMTVNAMIWAMTLFPEVQRKAQAELDRVLGNTEEQVLRLPSFEDRPLLPYIDAVIKESLRWHVAVPLALNHSSLEDTVFQGYFIPKDSIIFPNVWQMSRDTEYYADPEEFRPERHLGENPELDPYNYAFGFGGRICPGRHYADSTAFIVIASLLSAFDFLPPVGPNGKEILRQPIDAHAGEDLPIDMRVRPRSEAFATFVKVGIEY